MIVGNRSLCNSLTATLKIFQGWTLFLLSFIFGTRFGEYEGSLPSSITKTLKITHEMRKSFPNIYAALRILATIPVTSCEVEQAVSVLRRLKTYLWSTMENDRLNGLSLMTIHHDIVLNFDEILNRFARDHPRRMELLEIFSDDMGSQ